MRRWSALLLKRRADPNQTLGQRRDAVDDGGAHRQRAGHRSCCSQARAKIDAREKLRGTTALMWAAANSNTDAVRLLIAKGADINARSGDRGAGPQAVSRADRGASASRNSSTARACAAPSSRRDAPDTTSPARWMTPQRKAAAQQRFDAEIARRQGARSRSSAPRCVRAARRSKQWGGLTPLLFAAREGNIETVKALLDAGADVNQRSEYGWTALLVATQNRFYRLGVFLLEQGADPNIANEGGWNPLYIATDNRNIEAGDYPTRKPDMDHLEYIKRLLAAGANPNLRMHSSTETRTVFTHQWLYEEGATPFLRAAQSGDIVLMKLLLEHGADPSISTDHKVTPLMVASGIGWVEGVTYEWSPQAHLETVKLLLDLGADVNAQDTLDGRTALMGAAHKGRNDVVKLLVEHGADLGAARHRQPRQHPRARGRARGRPSTTRTGSCASACSPPSRIRKRRRCCGG